jgi:hypothetical protein
VKHQSHEEWGVRYGVVVGKDRRIVTKQRFFPDEGKRDRFIEKLVDENNFKGIVGYSDPGKR